MTNEKILERLKATGIRMEKEVVVPVKGKQVPLPYLVVRNDDSFSGSDNGRVLISTSSNIVALFTVDKAPELEAKIIRVLAPVAEFTVERFPDGTPYQTNFEFTLMQQFK